MNKIVTIPQLFPAEVSAWDEDEKERRAAAGREVLERIRRAGRDGSGTVRIPPGDYRFPGREGMLLENLRDISLEAEGATFWFSPEVTAGVHFRNCRNVRLSGLALDMEELPFLQGILLEVGEERLVIRLEEYFRRRFHEQRDQDHFRLMFLDVAGECETDNLDFIVPREKLSLDAAGNLLVPVSEPVARHWRYQLRVPRPGDRVVLGMRHEGGMLLVDGCEAMCFEAVTVYASPCFAFYEIGHGGGGNTYRGCRLIRRPGTDRLLASAADCFHSMNQRRGPLIEQCEFSWAMDDFVNIHGYFHVVLEQLSEDELLIVTPFGTGLQPGTELTFFSAPYGREKFRAAVVSRQESAGSEQEGLRRVRELYGRKFGIGLQGFPGRLFVPGPVRPAAGYGAGRLRVRLRQLRLRRGDPPQPFSRLPCARHPAESRRLPDRRQPDRTHRPQRNHPETGVFLAGGADAPEYRDSGQYPDGLRVRAYRPCGDSGDVRLLRTARRPDHAGCQHGGHRRGRQPDPPVQRGRPESRFSTAGLPEFPTIGSKRRSPIRRRPAGSISANGWTSPWKRFPRKNGGG